MLSLITQFTRVQKKNSTDNVYVIGYPVKYSKEEAVKLLLTPGNSASTLIWNYTKCTFDTGAEVQVTDGKPLFLKSNPDSTERDNLLHLINYGYIMK